MKNSRTSKKNIKSKNNVKRKVKVSPSKNSAKKVNKNVKQNNIKTTSNTKRPTNNNTINTKKSNMKVYEVDLDMFEMDNSYNENDEQITRKKVVNNNNNDNRKNKQNNVKKQNSRKRNPFLILKIVFFIAILTVIIYLMFTVEAFNLTKIEVKGNEKYNDETVIKNSNLKIGDNVFKQLLLNKMYNIDLAYISKAKYKYSFPNSIVIDVKERYPEYIAVDKNTSKCYMIDNEGYLLEECKLSERGEELEVNGFTFEKDVTFGRKINEVYLNKLEIYKNIKKELENIGIVASINKVNFANSLTIITLDDKLNIVFANDSNLKYKVAFLKGIIDQNGGIVEGTIDMSVDNPVYSKYD